MRNMKLIVLTLGLIFTSVSAMAGGAAELILKPADEVVQILVSKYQFNRAQAEVLASTITKGAKVALRKQVPATEEALIKALDDKGQKALASFLRSIEDVEKLSDDQLARLNDEFGVAVSKTAKAAEICETCGIDEVLLKRLGIKYYIPVSTDIPDSLFGGVSRNVDELASYIASGRNVKVTKSKLLAAMSSKSKTPVSDVDLAKMAVAVEAIDGKHGKEAQAYVLAALELGNGDVLSDSRLIATAASLIDDTQDGKIVMKEMSEVMNDVNKKHKSVPARRKALCEHYKAKASKTSTQADDIALKNLKQCPNYAPIFGAC